MIQISLLYHDVVDGDAEASGFPGADGNSYKLETPMFASHLDRINDVARERVCLVEPTGSFGAVTAPVLFTFDDGGVSAYEPTASMLEAKGWRGHFFIVTARIGQPGFLNADQLRGLRKRGHHIGSHSHTHPKAFSRLSREEMLHEWKESRRILMEVLGEDVWSTSVPGGFYSREVAEAASEAGYKVLFNSEPTAAVKKVGELVILGRYGIKRETSADAAQALARGDLFPRVRQSFTWNAKKPLKKIGGGLWFAFRRWFFARTS